MRLSYDEKVLIQQALFRFLREIERPDNVAYSRLSNEDHHTRLRALYTRLFDALVEDAEGEL